MRLRAIALALRARRQLLLSCRATLVCEEGNAANFKISVVTLDEEGMYMSEKLQARFT